MKNIFSFYLFLLFSLFILQWSVAQPSKPFLTLNTQMHTGSIWRISTDGSGKYLLTASDDKTAKLWDALTGELIRTYHTPIHNGNEGKLHACALSPDGATVVLGGWTGHEGSHNFSLYIFNAWTGAMVKSIAGLPDVIKDLEFSPDGAFLAASLWGSNGINVYLTNEWVLFKTLSGYSQVSSNVCFDLTGRLATVCDDGMVRLYDKSFNLISQTNQLAGIRSFSITFSPDGNKLAVGYSDSPIIEVLDGKTLHLLYRPDIAGANTVNNRIDIVTFSSKGDFLYGGGFYSKTSTGKWKFQIRCWKDSGRGSYIDTDAGNNSIWDLKSLPDGDIIFGGSYPDFGRITADRNKIYYKQAETNDYAAIDKSHLKTDDSGSTIAFTSLGKEPMRFSVNGKNLSPYTSFANEASFIDQLGNMSLTDWNGNPTPKLNGKLITILNKNEFAQSVDISRAQNNIILGTGWSLCCLNGAGEKQWKIPVPGFAWAVKITGNGNAVIAAFSDGTIRWYRMSDGSELLALYAHPDNKRWVLWTPSGYYDCSAGAEDLVGWHINNGADREASYYPISKFRNTYYRPDVISNILETLDEDEALRRANLENNRKPQNTDITRMLPPGVNISYPMQGQEVSARTLTLKYMLQSPNNEPVISVKAYINGRPAETQAVLKPAGQQQQVILTIPENDCKVSLVAENRFGYSDPAIVSLVWKGRNAADEMLFPKLYLVAIGVTEYDNPDFKLKYAAKDARDFAASMKSQEGGLYSKVVTKVLTDQLATKDNILDALDWLQKETTSRDVAIIYLSGHGLSDNTGVFYYLPFNADMNYMKRTCLMFGDIKTTTGSVAGKMLLFVDACHSGDVMGRNRGYKAPDTPALANELSSAENGVVVFTSCTGRQLSIEDSTWNNGAFTKALVEGIMGKADLLKKGKVTVKGLDLYVTERVKDLTDTKQSPTAIIPESVPDFPIAAVK